MILTLLCGWWLCMPTPAQAQTIQGAIQVMPAFQEITLTEATPVATASIQLSNTSQLDQQFGITPIDIQQFDANGQIILADKPLVNQNTAFARFITTTPDKITVPKLSTVTIPLTITNAQSLSPGGHYAAIVARLISETGSDQRILPAVSSFLLVRKVGGEQFHLSLKRNSLLDSITTSLPKETLLTFSNQGNVHVIPRGTLMLKDFFGNLVAKSTINENSLYVFPGTERELTQKITYLRPVWFPMFLTITITGSSQPGEVTFQQSGWLLYCNPISLAIILGVLSFGGWHLMQTRRQP